MAIKSLFSIVDKGGYLPIYIGLLLSCTGLKDAATRDDPGQARGHWNAYSQHEARRGAYSEIKTILK